MKSIIIILACSSFVILGSYLLFNKQPEKKQIEAINKDSEDSVVKGITTLLMDFKLLEEDQIKNETKREELLALHINKKYFIVYENGCIINKVIKTVDNIDYFRNNKSIELQGSQHLAYFKALALFELPGHFEKGPSGSYKDAIYVVNNERNPLKEPDLNEGSRSLITMDINQKIEDIERVEDAIKGYTELSNWLQEAKSHLVKAKKVSVEKWDEYNAEYIKASNMFDKLHKSLHESYDYYQEPPAEDDGDAHL